MKDLSFLGVGGRGMKKIVSLKRNEEEDGLGFACLFGITRMHAASLMCLDYQKCSLPSIAPHQQALQPVLSCNLLLIF